MNTRTRSPASDLALGMLAGLAVAAIGTAIIFLPCLTLWAIEATARFMHGHP